MNSAILVVNVQFYVPNVRKCGMNGN